MTRSPTLDVFDVGAGFDDFAGDLVAENHAGGCGGAAADHVLIGAADVGGDDLQDDAVIDLFSVPDSAFWGSRWTELRLCFVRERLLRDFPPLLLPLAAFDTRSDGSLPRKTGARCALPYDCSLFAGI